MVDLKEFLLCSSMPTKAYHQHVSALWFFIPIQPQSATLLTHLFPQPSLTDPCLSLHLGWTGWKRTCLFIVFVLHPFDWLTYAFSESHPRFTNIHLSAHQTKYRALNNGDEWQILPYMTFLPCMCCMCKIMMHSHAVWVAISLHISLALVCGGMPVAFWVLRSFFFFFEEHNI